MQKLFILLLILISTNSWAESLKGWKKLYSKSGLTFYSMTTKGSSLLKFRAKGILNTDTKETLAILRNVEENKKWDKNTKAKYTIENISDIEAITYSRSSIPWPFKDREFILRNKLSVNKKEMTLIVKSDSMVDKRSPKRKKYVRANINVIFRIRPLKNKTLVDMIIKVDPKGSIPHWVVNIVQKSMPYDFLTSITNYANKVTRVPNKGVMDLYNKLVLILESGVVIPKF
ncbi:MAG: hypothetical protein ACI9QD_000785 [Thermoproteota archaeon]|jgi:hypothetical protein